MAHNWSTAKQVSLFLAYINNNLQSPNWFVFRHLVTGLRYKFKNNFITVCCPGENNQADGEFPMN